MKGRGSLQIRVRPIQLSHAPAAEFDPPMSAGEYAEVSIKDTGPGIDHLILRRGGVMRRRHASESGWGIGLTVIQACAVRANGSVKITSEEGRGTCVKIVLPVASTRRRHNSKASVVKCS
jgi:signal transduction histidine kinase